MKNLAIDGAGFVYTKHFPDQSYEELVLIDFGKFEFGTEAPIFSPIREYPTLNKMEQEGLIVIRESGSVIKYPVISLTPKGYKKSQELLLLPVYNFMEGWPSR